MAVLAIGLAGTIAMPVQAAELVLLEARGCPWCKRSHAEAAEGYATSTEGKRAPLRWVELSAAGGLGIAFVAPVRASPPFVLVERCREVGRITGYQGADFFWPELRQLVAKLDTALEHELGPPPESNRRTSCAAVANTGRN